MPKFLTLLFDGEVKVMEGVLGVWVRLHSFLTMAPDGEWSASRPDCFTPGKQPTVPIEEEAGWTP